MPSLAGSSGPGCRGLAIDRLINGVSVASVAVRQCCDAGVCNLSADQLRLFVPWRFVVAVVGELAIDQFDQLRLLVP
jgi:hypothetical protein